MSFFWIFPNLLKWLIRHKVGIGGTVVFLTIFALATVAIHRGLLFEVRLSTFPPNPPSVVHR